MSKTQAGLLTHVPQKMSEREWVTDEEAFRGDKRILQGKRLLHETLSRMLSSILRWRRPAGNEK